MTNPFSLYYDYVRLSEFSDYADGLNDTKNYSFKGYPFQRNYTDGGADVVTFKSNNGGDVCCWIKAVCSSPPLQDRGCALARNANLSNGR